MTWLLGFMLLSNTLPIKDNNPIVSLQQLEDRSYQINAQFSTNALPTLVFDTLTDYEHHPQFLHTIKKVVEVKFLQRSPKLITKVIDEEITVHVLVFSETVHVTLLVNEFLDRNRIEFEDLSHKDFTYYKGYWQIDTQKDINIVTHQITLLPKVKTPNWLVKHLFKKDASKLLDELQDEIIKRTRR
jgi:ribosome-associated toxin RatA of RatAB toxin-antitoxin module